MNEIYEIHKLIETINRDHKHHISSLSKDDEVLFKIKLQNGKDFKVKLSRDGLHVFEDEDCNIKNVVEISSKDLFKLLNNRSYILRYITTGRIRIKGNIKKVLEILRNI
ncbi:MAG: SCP2 sterol-binding domain-containing protein [Hydrogenothermaceae bacterium]